MLPALTIDQVLALAPDAGSAKSGRGLASAKAWRSLGRSERAIWGECQGSAREPYRTQVDLSEPAFRCSCPSRKFPCKHSIGLLLLLAAQPGLVPEAAPPDWVTEWLAGRSKSAERREQRKQAADGAGDEQRRAAAQAKSAAAREAKVAAGMQELGRWLCDQVREGLAGAPGRAPAPFDRMAARMVDAQAAGAARMLRALGGVPASGDGWHSRLLERLSRLHLLTAGYGQIDALSPEEQADIRGAVGFTLSQEELLQGPGRRDHWLVLGRRVEDEDHLRVQRTWLWGQQSAAPALVLDFSAAGQPLDRSLTPGSLLDADLVFYPGAAPLRALVQRRRGHVSAPDSLPGCDIAAALGDYAAALARNPWLERYPLCLGPITLAPQGAAWLARDEVGRALPISPLFDRAWELLARSGGRPFNLCGEWDGDQLTPLAAWIEGFVDLSGSGPSARPAVGRAPVAIWGDLVAAALLGTDRRAPALPAADGALGALLGRLAFDDSQPAALLGAAAAVALYQRAGWVPPPTDADPLAPAPPDDLPRCAARAAGHLAQMLSGAHSAALPEWLAALAASRRCVSPALLPDLLDRGRAEESLRPAVLAVLGARGRWLAGLNPAWDYAAVAEGDSVEYDATALWETGSPAARLALLGQLRQTDPARARKLLAATWATEKADERVAFLGALAKGLSMADEPFLEQTLDDRSERVRRAAAGLLAALPDSRLSQRMFERAAALLSWSPGRLLQRASVVVDLPEEYDAAMQRDGIVRKPVGAALGERAWWLNQMLEQLPPSRWSKAWGASPGEILTARLPKEWRGLLLVSWAEAARRHADLPWLEALVDLARAGEGALAMAELLPVFPPARREQIAVELLQAEGALSGDRAGTAVLRTLPGPWGHRLARAALAALGRRLRSGEAALQSDWHLRSALELFAVCIPANLAEEATAAIPRAAAELPYWGAAIRQFEELVWFRYEMLAALGDEGPATNDQRRRAPIS